MAAPTTIYSESGRGLIHQTIGTSPSLDDPSPAIIEILKLLVQYGASLSKRDKSSLKRTPLHYCTITKNLEAARYILREDDNVLNSVDADNKTSLVSALQSSFRSFWGFLQVKLSSDLPSNLDLACLTAIWTSIYPHSVIERQC